MRSWEGGLRAAACAVTLVGACAASSASQTAVGNNVHDVTLKDLQGRVATLRPYAGKVLVVHVFATWDMSSLRSVQELNNLQDQRGKSVQVVGVGVDLEGRLAVEPFITTFKPTYPIFLPDALFNDGRTPFGHTKEVPRFFIVGKDGTIKGAYAGYVPYPELLKMVDVERGRN